MVLRFLAKGAATIVVALLLVWILQALTLPSLVRAAAVLVVTLLAFWFVLRCWSDVGARSIEELQHGYTTFVLEFGTFGVTEGRRWKNLNRRAPWDYAGVWVIDGRTGRVISAPDPEVDPPGFYPSPNRPGAEELWSGVVWTGQYRSP